jgi:hypothetical protein
MWHGLCMGFGRDCDGFAWRVALRNSIYGDFHIKDNKLVTCLRAKYSIKRLKGVMVSKRSKRNLPAEWSLLRGKKTASQKGSFTYYAESYPIPCYAVLS